MSSSIGSVASIGLAGAAAATCIRRIPRGRCRAPIPPEPRNRYGSRGCHGQKVSIMLVPKTDLEEAKAGKVMMPWMKAYVSFQTRTKSRLMLPILALLSLFTLACHIAALIAAPSGFFTWTINCEGLVTVGEGHSAVGLQTYKIGWVSYQGHVTSRASSPDNTLNNTDTVPVDSNNTIFRALLADYSYDADEYEYEYMTLTSLAMSEDNNDHLPGGREGIEEQEAEKGGDDEKWREGFGHDQSNRDEIDEEEQLMLLYQRQGKMNDRAAGIGAVGEEQGAAVTVRVLGVASSSVAKTAPITDIDSGAGAVGILSGIDHFVGAMMCCGFLGMVAWLFDKQFCANQPLFKWTHAACCGLWFCTFVLPGIAFYFITKDSFTDAVLDTLYEDGFLCEQSKDLNGKYGYVATGFALVSQLAFILALNWFGYNRADKALTDRLMKYPTMGNIQVRPADAGNSHHHQPGWFGWHHDARDSR